MSDPKPPKTPPPCPSFDPAVDSQRVRSANAACMAYKGRCDELESIVDTLIAENDAMRDVHANDLTREHRDLIRSQSLAMLSADTRIAASTAALGVFCAVGAPYISQGVDNATDYIVRALRGAGKSIGRAMDDPGIRSGFLAGLITSLADNGINLADMIGAVTAGISDAPDPAPIHAPSKSASPSDAKPDAGAPAKKPTAKKRAK